MHTSPEEYTNQTYLSDSSSTVDWKGDERTIGMPQSPTNEPHRRRIQRVVFRELEFGGEDPAFVRCALGPLDHGFPSEYVVFGHGTGGDPVGRGGEQGAVFLEEALCVHCRGCRWGMRAAIVEELYVKLRLGRGD